MGESTPEELLAAVKQDPKAFHSALGKIMDYALEAREKRDAISEANLINIGRQETLLQKYDDLIKQVDTDPSV